MLLCLESGLHFIISPVAMEKAIYTQYPILTSYFIILSDIKEDVNVELICMIVNNYGRIHTQTAKSFL